MTATYPIMEDAGRQAAEPVSGQPLCLAAPELPHCLATHPSATTSVQGAADGLLPPPAGPPLLDSLPSSLSLASPPAGSGRQPAAPAGGRPARGSPYSGRRHAAGESLLSSFTAVDVEQAACRGPHSGGRNLPRWPAQGLCSLRLNRQASPSGRAPSGDGLLSRAAAFCRSDPDPPAHTASSQLPPNPLQEFAVLAQLERATEVAARTSRVHLVGCPRCFSVHLRVPWQ